MLLRKQSRKFFAKLLRASCVAKSGPHCGLKATKVGYKSGRLEGVRGMAGTNHDSGLLMLREVISTFKNAKLMRVIGIGD